ncbi:platelet binding protein GspB [Nematostella vectensis]|uniref:platelet binding protein GspB n=1 Tax=Nematostella vectensis TaxID=45351 RepID=UPI002076D9DC|nr:platelet binding protein GspB [Nematostella vectensis]
MVILILCKCLSHVLAMEHTFSKFAFSGSTTPLESDSLAMKTSIASDAVLASEASIVPSSSQASIASLTDNASLGVKASTTESVSLGISASTTESASLGVKASTTESASLGISASTTESVSLGISASTTESASLEISASTTQSVSLEISASTTQSASLGLNASGVVYPESISASPAATVLAVSSYICNPDCHGTCEGEAQLNECNVCYGGLTGKYSNDSKDCNGTCHGAATLDSCGNCTGGTTGKTAGFAKDACGVCHGDSSSCQGCDGVPNSGKVKDACGICGGDGTKCTALSGLKCPAADKASAEVTFYGGGLNTGTPTCKVLDPSTGAVLQTAQATNATVTQASCTLTAWSSFTVGQYNFSIHLEKSDGTVVNVSNVLQLYFYDSASIKFTRISPETVLLTDLPKDVFITGSRFFSGSEQYCYFGDAKVPATLMNDTTLKCTVPTSSVSSRPTVAVTLNGGCNNFTTSLQLTLQAAAPDLTKAQFTDNGAQIQATFSTDVSTASLTTCSAILDSATVAKLGTGPTCSWTSKSTLVITTGTSATIMPSDSLTLKDDALKADGQTYSRSASGSVTVQSPTNPAFGVPVISGPQYLSVCGNLSLTGTQSSGGGGRTIKYLWRLKTPPSGVNVTALNSYLNGKNDSTLDIDGSLLESGKEYDFELCVSNFLNYTNPICALHKVTKTSVAGPVVTVSAPLNDPVAKTVLVSQEFFITAKAEAASCSNISTPKINFEWRASCADSVAQTAIEGNADFTATKNTANLKIAARVLQAGKMCTFTVKGIIASLLDVFSEASVDINPRSTPITAIVAGGNRETGRTCSELRLQTQVTDPDQLAGDPSCTWACQTSAGGSCGSATRVGQAISPASTCDSKVTCEEFRVGTTYIFTVTTIKDSRRATASTQVKVVPGSPPEVWVEQAEVKVAVSEEFTLKGFFKTSLEPSLIQWTNVTLDGFLVAASGSLYKSYTANQASLAHSIFPPNFFTKGAKYRYELQVTLDGTVGRAYTDVIARQGPTSGTLVSSAASAEILSAVTLSAGGWVAEDDGAKPLKYTFYQDKTVVYSGTSTTASATVSTGRFSVQVTDAYGSTTIKYLNITATTPTNTSAAVSSVLSAAQSLSESGDAAAAVASLASTASYLASTNASAEQVQGVLDAITNTAISAASSPTAVISPEASKIYIDTLLANPPKNDSSKSDALASTITNCLKSYANPDDAFLNKTASLLGTLDPTASADSKAKLQDAYTQLALQAAKVISPGEKKCYETDHISIQVELTTGSTPVSGCDGTQATVPTSAFCSSSPCEPIATTVSRPKSPILPTGEATLNPVMTVDVYLAYRSGKRLSVSNLVDPVTIVLAVSTQPPDGYTYQCKFYDEANKVWSTQGVTTQFAKGGDVTCLSKHLTMFGAVVVRETLDIKTPPPGVEPANHRLAVEINQAFFTNGWNDTVMASTSSPGYQAALQQVQNALAKIFANQSYYGASEMVLSSKDGKVFLTALLKFSPNTTGVLEAFKAGVAKEGYQINSNSAVVTNESGSTVPVVDKDDDETAAIIGGTVGGTLALLLMIGAVIYRSKANANKVVDGSAIPMSTTA